MAVSSIKEPFITILNRSGIPLEDGNIYIGEYGKNPRVYPINVYWDISLSAAAVQPIKTLNGHPVNNGTPSALFVNSKYSISFYDKNDELVYSSINNDVDPIVVSVGLISNLIGYAPDTELTVANVSGYISNSDGGEGSFVWDSTVDKSTANAGTIIDPSVSLANQGTGVGLGCWARQYAGSIYVEWFGATGDGSTSDTTAWNNALSLGGYINGSSGKTYSVGALNLASNIHIDLNGSTLERNTSELNGNVDAYNISAAIFGLDTTPLSNFSIRNGTINDKNTLDITVYRPFMTILYSNVEDVIFENLTFTNSRHGLLFFSNNGATGYAKRVKMINCKFLSPYVPPVGSSPSDLTINYCLASIDYGTDCIVSGCEARSTTHLTIMSGFSCIIENSSCYDSIDTALYFYGNEHKMINNRVVNAGKDGLKLNSLTLDNSSSCFFSGNTVSGKMGRYKSDGGYGAVFYGNNGVFSDNNISLDGAGEAVTLSSCLAVSGTSNNINNNHMHSIASSVQGIFVNNSSLAGDTNNLIIESNKITANATLIGMVNNIKKYKIVNNIFNAYGAVVAINVSNTPVGDNLIPVFGNISSNTFIGHNDLAIMIYSTGSDRIVVSDNIITGTRQRDISNPNDGGSVIGDNNFSDHGISDSTFNLYRLSPRGVQYYITPAKGTFIQGDIVAGLSDGQRCTASGTAGTITACTATTTAASKTITISAAGAVLEGYFITIAGTTGTYYVTSSIGTTAEVTPAVNASVSGAAVSFSNPTWSTRSEYYG